MGKFRVFTQNFTFWTTFSTFHWDHVSADIRWESTHCNIYMRVHWYCQEYTTCQTIIGVIHGKLRVFAQNFTFSTIFSQFTATIWTPINLESIYIAVYAYVSNGIVTNIPQREKLYGNKWVNYEFSPKISLFTLYFSSSPGPYAAGHAHSIHQYVRHT